MIPPDRKQLLEPGAVPDPPHNQPGGDRVPGGGERGELFDLGDLAVEAICLVLGAEGAGLSRLVRERCDVVVNIPMLGRISSLNVSAAAALATYEVARRRR